MKCPYRRYCYRKECESEDYDDCAMYYKIDDLLMDAQMAAAEERAMEDREDPDDWYDL